jgi:hypothetical protein
LLVLTVAERVWNTVSKEMFLKGRENLSSNILMLDALQGGCVPTAKAGCSGTLVINYLEVCCSNAAR